MLGLIGDSITPEMHYLWLIFIIPLRTERNVLLVVGLAKGSGVCLRNISEQQKNCEDEFKIPNLQIFICFSHEFSFLHPLV